MRYHTPAADNPSMSARLRLPHRTRYRVALGGLALVLTLGVVAAAQEVRVAYSHAGEKLSLTGVGNFGRMSERLYRGAQPTPSGFVALKQMNIDTVVRFSMGDEGAATEQAQVESLGMSFVNLPWSTQGEPDRE